MGQVNYASKAQLIDIMGDAATKIKTKFEDYYDKDQVDKKIDEAATAAYKPAGSIAGSELTAALLTEANEGNVYNITSDFDVTAENAALFKDRNAGEKIIAGENVGVVWTGAYVEASGLKIAGTTYFERTGEEGSYVYTEKEVADGGSVAGLYVKGYTFDVLAGFINYTEGDGIDIDANRGVSVKLVTNANGLKVGNDGLGIDVVKKTTYKAATGTFNNTVRYFDVDGNEVDTSNTEEFVVDTTDMSSYFVVDEVGSAGAMSEADKKKLDNMNAAEDLSAADVTAIKAAFDLET